MRELDISIEPLSDELMDAYWPPLREGGEIIPSHERFHPTGQERPIRPVWVGQKMHSRAVCWRRGANRSVDHTLIRGLVTA